MSLDNFVADTFHHLDRPFDDPFSAEDGALRQEKLIVSDFSELEFF